MSQVGELPGGSANVQQEIAPPDSQADHADFISLLGLRVCHVFAF
jgi:hypothetical protein